MSHKNLQEAIEKISNDSEYCETVVVDPERLQRDFGLNEEEMEILEGGRAPGMKDERSLGESLECVLHGMVLEVHLALERPGLAVPCRASRSSRSA